MSSTQIYARGRPVYGGGSFAPNIGQVSARGAQGYLRREIKRQNKGPFGGVSAVGNDGASDTRSGVTSNTLARTTSVSPIRRPTPTGGSGSSHPDTVTHPNTNGTNEHGQNTGGSGGGSGGSGSGGGSGGGNTPNTPNVPQVVVNPDGTLQLPYDQQFSNEVLDALDQYNMELMDLQQESQQQSLNYAVGRRDAGINYEKTKRSDLNTSAARGTAFSSQYGTSVANSARDYQNKLNDLDNNYNLFNQSAAAKRAAIITVFQRMLARAALDNANNLDDNAGNLGLGGDGGTTGGGGGGTNTHGQQTTGGPVVPHIPGSGVPTPGGGTNGPTNPSGNHQPPHTPGGGGNNGGGPRRRKRR